LLSNPTLQVAAQLLIVPRRAVSIAAPNDGALTSRARRSAKVSLKSTDAPAAVWQKRNQHWNAATVGTIDLRAKFG
jgi:hypothetical protein